MASNYTIRPVSNTDLNETTINRLATIEAACFHQDPYFEYLFPYGKDAPNEFFEYCRLRLEECLLDVNQGALYGVLAEVPKDGEIGDEKEVVAYSFWLPIDAEVRSVDQQPYQCSDAHLATISKKRIDAFNAIVLFKGNEWFGIHWQLELDNIAVHPDYQRKGVGSAIVQWGIQRAKDEKYPAVVLFADQLGKKLYDKLGFTSVGTARVQVEGEEAFWDVEGMAYRLSD